MLKFQIHHGTGREWEMLPFTQSHISLESDCWYYKSIILLVWNRFVDCIHFKRYPSERAWCVFLGIRNCACNNGHFWYFTWCHRFIFRTSSSKSVLLRWMHIWMFPMNARCNCGDNRSGSVLSVILFIAAIILIIIGVVYAMIISYLLIWQMAARHYSRLNAQLMTRYVFIF